MHIEKPHNHVDAKGPPYKGFVKQKHNKNTLHISDVNVFLKRLFLM